MRFLHKKGARRYFICFTLTQCMADYSTFSVNFIAQPVLVGGPSGMGKTTLISDLITRYPEYFERPISYTTRPKRTTEDNSEYEFVSIEQFNELSNENKFVTVDNVYGHFYAMTTESINQILRKGKVPIKEIHPKNFHKIKEKYPDLLTILLIGKQIDPNTPDERIIKDASYFQTIDSSIFDLIMLNDLTTPITNRSKYLFNIIHVTLSTSQLFPRPNTIDEVNVKGYDLIANEFTEEKRITTKNFHTVSFPYFDRSIKEYIKEGDKVLEVGPGRNWLLNNFKFPEIEYSAIEISNRMIIKAKTSDAINSSIRYSKFDSEIYDIVIASLADPNFYPASICEIYRILKYNGFFIFSIPSSNWSDNLRDSEKNKTTFQYNRNKPATVYSFTFNPENATRLTELCGFKTIESYGVKAKFEPSEKISEAIITACKNSGKSTLDLEILTFIICQK